MAPQYLDIKSLENLSGEIKNIFFFRICGTGMGAAACLLQQKGYQVSGCDLSFSPPMSDFLESTQIELYSMDRVDREFLEQFDLVVVGNSIPKASDHARMITEANCQYCSFPAAIGALVLKDVHVVGVGGTHGKTTTTYFFSQVFRKLGVLAGHFIGGVIDGEMPAVLPKDSDQETLFFIESDEYDCAFFEKFSKFRQYQIDDFAITSLEYDHADIFESVEKIQDEFKVALRNLSGTVYSCQSYPELQQLKAEASHWKTYGEGSEFGPKKIQNTPEGTLFEVYWGGKNHSLHTNLKGNHNILNLAVVIQYALDRGHKIEEISQAIADLAMVKRRQEIRGKFQEALVIDDFAHHPTAVASTVETIVSTYPGKDVWVVFDPISATARSDVFQAQFAKSFSQVNGLVVANSGIKTTAIGRGELDTERLVEDVKKEFDVPAETVSTLDQLSSKLKEIANSSTILLVLSNRTCLGLWESDFVSQLKD